VALWESEERKAERAAWLAGGDNKCLGFVITVPIEKRCVMLVTFVYGCTPTQTKGEKTRQSLWNSCD
jgi:hypothetical protein